MSSSKDKLASVRASIDGVDEKIARLLARRMRLSAKIGRIKGAARTGGYADPAREAKVIRRVREAAGEDLSPAFVERVYREIMAESLARQQPQRVCYLGPEGTFSHEASLHHFSAAAEHVPLASIGACFDAVEHEQVDFAIVPYENSTEGGVGETLDRLAVTTQAACGETQLRIRQHLLGRPKMQVGRIRTLYSHPQSFAQCRRWLSENLPTCKLVECASNGAAAHHVAAARSACAAIGPAGAAAVNGLQILDRDLEDNPRNVTRFLIVGGKSARPTGDDKCSLIFATPDRPGSLFAALELFADARMNMQRLESRPVPGREFGQYMFFIDVGGHHDREPLKGVLAALREKTAMLKVLGSYPRATVVG